MKFFSVVLKNADRIRHDRRHLMLPMNHVELMSRRSNETSPPSASSHVT